MPGLMTLADFTEEVRALTQRLAPGIAAAPRRQPGLLELCGQALAYADLHSAYHQLRQIFLQRLYAVALAGPCLAGPCLAGQPRIIDLGGHVGLASIYFGLAHPGARLTCVEADPDLCALLRRNLEAVGLAGVDVRCAAAWTHARGVSFQRSGDDSGCVGGGAGAGAVASLRVADLLAEGPVDLLKLDIEGAELEVIPDCAEVLANVSRLIVEVHSLQAEPARLGALFATLDRAGFSYSLQDHHPAAWLPDQGQTPFPGLPAVKYIFTLYAWQDALAGQAGQTGAARG